MKVALPSKDMKIDDHFGHCDHFMVFNVEDDKRITGEERVDSPQGCGCKSDIAERLAAMGVSVMLAGNMGQGAVNRLAESNIEVVRGCAGDIREVLQLWLDGEIKDSGIGCSDHGDDHECGHSHAPKAEEFTFATK